MIGFGSINSGHKGLTIQVAMGSQCVTIKNLSKFVFYSQGPKSQSVQY